MALPCYVFTFTIILCINVLGDYFCIFLLSSYSLQPIQYTPIKCKYIIICTTIQIGKIHVILKYVKNYDCFYF